MELQSRDVTRLTHTDGWDGSATYAPDGRDLAFAVKRFRNTMARGEIWRVRADGTDAAPITGPDVTAAGMPDFGADGKKIVFAAKVGVVTNIMMMNDKWEDGAPCWAPGIYQS